MLGVGVLASGGGTNLQAILDAEKSGMIRHAKVVYVLSGNVAVYALQRATAAGTANECISPMDLPDREAFHRALLEAMEREKLDLIILAGYLVKISDETVHRYRGRTLNIYPSLIPSSCDKGTHGLKVHRQALWRGAKMIGATVHLVDEGLGEGPILLQKVVEVKPGDTPETLQRHVTEEAEWILLPRATEEMAREAGEKGDGA